MKHLACLVLALILLFPCALADRGAPQIEKTYTARTVVVRCAGDFVIHKSLIEAARRAGTGGAYSFAGMLENVRDYLAAADLTVTNVDGVMAVKEVAKRYGYSGYPAFSTPNDLIWDLKDCGVDLLTLANNHALDYWYDGLKSTVTSVEQAGLMSVGGYRSLEEKRTPRVMEINGIRLGFLNYTDGLNQMDKRSALDKAALEYGVDFLERADVDADVERLREAGAEVILCFMHWGIEYRSEPCQSQKENARMLARAGVDVIIGGHPHVAERAEYINVTTRSGEERSVLCLYSLGNFLTGQRDIGCDAGMIFDFTISRDETGQIAIGEPQYRTTWVWPHMVNGQADWRVLFSGLDAVRPQGMSDADFKRMQQSAAETIKLMDSGCAVYAGYAQSAAPMVETPGR